MADLAERHLTNYTGAIERISEIMPGVVARELAKDGHETDKSAVAETRKMVAAAWKTALADGSDGGCLRVFYPFRWTFAHSVPRLADRTCTRCPVATAA